MIVENEKEINSTLLVLRKQELIKERMYHPLRRKGANSFVRNEQGKLRTKTRGCF